MITLSTLPRVMECPASEAFVHSPTSGSTPSTYGQEGHAFLARVSEAGYDVALREVPDDSPVRRLCEAIPPALVPKGGQVELAVAFDPRREKGRILGQNLRREYGKLGKGEIPGALDWCAVRVSEGFILDWKLGHVSVGRAEDNWQVRGGAVALAYAHGFALRRVHVGLVYPREDGQAFASQATFDSMRLAADAERFRVMLRTVGSYRRLHAKLEPLPTHQGPWCTYCPAYDACPAKHALLGELRSGVNMADPISNDEAGALWVRLEQMGEALAHVKAKLEERARRSAFNTPRGTVVCEALGPERESVDAEKAFPVLRDRLGAQLALVACPMGATKQSVSDAARQHAKAQGLPIGETIEQTLDALRSAKAITKEPGKLAVREVTP